MKKLFGVALVLYLLAGCATAHKMNRIDLGMSKEEVIQKIGRPVSVGATQDFSFFYYKFYETAKDDFQGIKTPYYVRFKQGKVDAYGRSGGSESPESGAVLMPITPITIK